MKKLSKIIESIWSDMQDRSSGEIVRKEDLITTNEDLKNKILELYIEQGEGETLDVSSLTKLIKCDDFSYLFINRFKEVKHVIGIEDWDVSKVTNMKGMFYNCKNFNSDLSKWDVSSVEDMSGMFEECEKFNSDLSKWDVSNVKNVRNMFDDCKSLEQIPFWYTKKGLNESIWSDMQDRSAGDVVRKEDDINLLDKDGLFDYIYDLYKQIAIHPLPLKSQTSPTHTYFSIPIFKSDYKVYRLNCIFDNNKISEITLMASDADVKDFKQALIDNFNATINSDGALTITTKDGTVSNQVCMDLIKTIVENAPKPYLKKREN